jgi:hypothetical protein
MGALIRKIGLHDGMGELGVRFLIRPPIVMRGLDPRIHLKKALFEGDGLPGQARQ